MRNFTDISIILDRSGSMDAVRSDTIGGFNAFLTEQQKGGDNAALSLYQFDDQYDVVYTGEVLSKVDKLTNETFQPRGMTALYDAIGRTINSTGQRLAQMTESERPDKVVFVIMTDGLENASREFDALQVGELIREQTNVYNWEFVFIGANQDAILSARELNIPMANSITYAADAAGTADVYASLSANFLEKRAGYAPSMAFKSEDRAKQERGVHKSGARS